MRIANTVSDSIVDGPGLRFTVFTQGCPHRCPGCHNPGTHDPAGGREVSVAELAAEFGVSTAVGQWVTSGYSLAMGMVMPLTAFLITRFPTKKLYMTGIGCFIAGILLVCYTVLAFIRAVKYYWAHRRESQ